MGNLTKKERRQQQLERHYLSLAKLATICNAPKTDGKKISTKLLQLERLAHAAATAYCNGETVRIYWPKPFLIPEEYNFQADDSAWERLTERVKDCVRNIFGLIPDGFFVNGDARGYALKIDDELMRAKYAETELHKDWGGYGILAPEITGD